MSKLGALLLTPIGFVVGGFIGQGIGYASVSGQPSPYQTHRRDYVPQRIPQKVLDAEHNGGIIGAVLGATIVAVLAAGEGCDPPKQTGVGGIPISGVFS
jgi:hypothetical protein